MRTLTKLTPNTPVTQAELERLEELVSGPLPQELRYLLSEYSNCAILEKIVPPGNDLQVDRFLQFKILYRGCRTIFDHYENVKWYMEATTERYEMNNLEFHKFEWVPFARSLEDLFCYQLTGPGMGSIYLLKDENRMDDTFEFVANSLDEFLDSLYPEEQPIS